MSEAKFTKGEWKLRGNEVGVIDKSNSQSYGMMLSVARVDEHDFQSEWKANAHLIAAAPELYKELEGIYTNLAMAGGVLTLDEDDFTSIGKLLSKARGE